MRTSVDVHNYLIERGVAHELFAAAGRLRSPERIAAVLDLPPDDVGKVLILDGPDGPLAVAVPVDRDPDPDLVARAVGRAPIVPAADDRATEVTGYLAEAIPPAGLPEEIPLVLDLSLDRDAVLYFPGGEVRAVLKVRGHDLARATGAKVAPVAAAPARRPGAG